MRTVKQIMTTQFPHVFASMELTQALDAMNNYGVFGTPVIDQAGYLIGFISEQQMLKPLLDNSYFCNGQLAVGDLMSTEPLSVSPEMNVVDLAQLMDGNKPKIYPVVENGKVIGLVTRGRVIHALKQDYLSCSCH
ncbi:CBS domain-containing protein [Pseudoalteromonas xiamenensis]|uniref:CBS domain-containing protein n=1 Tax=Pseudoalteromonas xiamenensis TaxID=882626 RepID=UPI0027E51997|nr:CBS domain-containing protein [Pseudoalteromonas xiamenensis]WMN58495.1 CBS domain-containing protein [Pseudoalteromonas xiamenensis]